MSKTKKSDFILVFDRYFSHKQSALLSALKRVLYACLECVCMLFCLLEIYGISANMWLIAAFCVEFTAAFCALFCFVKKRFAVPTFLLVSGIIVYENREAIWEKFTYFIDAVFRAMDGSVFGMKNYMWHKDMAGNADNEIMFTLIMISCIFALICAGAMFKKPSGAVPLITFIVLFTPMVLAQNLTFNLWTVPTAALLLGSFAAARAFSSGVITRGGVYEGCRKAYRREERAFGSSAAKSTVINRAQLNAVHYTKYFSAAVSAAAVFTASGFIGAAIMNDYTGIDYSGIYDFFSNLGKQTNEPDDEEDADFLSLGFFTDEINHSLSIAQPGTNNREAFRVRNSGGTAYLRGDIGIDFEGYSWTSHTSRAWGGKDYGTPDKYRPAEAAVLKSIEESFRMKLPGIYGAIIPESYYSEKESALVKKGDIYVYYTADTNIVFLPTYIDKYSKYYDSGYELYGDYVARSNSEKIYSINFTSLIPSMNYTGSGAEDKLALVSAALRMNEFYNFPDKFDLAVVADWSGSGIYRDYHNYVLQTYLDVPDKMREELIDFLGRNNLYRSEQELWDNVVKYSLCAEITDFLKDNYTYSLSTNNSGVNPVMTFLTDTKSGHCALYASAMTLMLRSMGIPARYCTGFIAPHTNDGETAIIRMKNLHAWCEVYFNELGWITFDPTSSAVGGGIEISGSGSSSDSVSSDESSSNYELEISSFDVTDDDEEEEDDPGDVTESTPVVEEEPESVNVTPYVLTGLSAALVVAALSLMIYKFIRLDKKAKSLLEQAKTHGSCEELYAKMIAILQLCGYTQNPGEQPESYFTRVDMYLKTKLSKHSEMLMKIAFGESEQSSEELYETAVLLKALYESADSQLVAIGRVKLRRIIVNKMRV